MGLPYFYNYSRASQVKRLTACFSNTIRRYSQASKESNKQGVEERAPSTAEEFKRVAEEKARQGVASQTVDKALDAAQEAILSEPKVDCIKERYKEPLGKGNFRRID